MKILQINAVINTGSTGAIARGIAKVCEDNDDKVIFASPAASNMNTYKIGNSFDHKMHALLCRLTGKQGYFSIFPTIRLIHWIDKEKPDVIHLHNLHSNYINYILLLKYIQKKKIPTLVTMHDCWYFTGKCFHYLYDNCQRWKTGCGKCPRQHAEQDSFLFDKSSDVLQDKRKYFGENKYIYFIGCSKWITDEAKNSIIKDRVKGTIYNGIDLSIFYPKDNSIREQYGINEKFIILGMANKWLAKENRNTLIYILQNIKDNMVLMLIGTEKFEDFECTTNLILVPQVKEPEIMAEYYSAADVFVNVTKADTFPSVNIEAIACGTPVITYDSGGCGEISDTTVGFVVNYGDAECLFDSIQKVEKQGKMTFSSNCRKRAEKLFNRDECFLHYYNAYHEIINRGEEY